MGKEIITFIDIEVEKHKFHKGKSQISIDDVNVDRRVVSNRVPFGKKGFKYFIGCEDGKTVRTLCITLPKMNAYMKDFNESKCMSFLIK